MSKREGPETQVGGSVRNSSEHELDGLNQLMDESLTEGLGVLLSAHVLELLVDGLHLALAGSHNVVRHTIRVSLHAWVDKVLGHVVGSNVGELNLVVLLWWSSGTAAAWLDEEHEWNDEDDDDQCEEDD